MAPQRDGGVVVVGDPAGRVGGVDGCWQRAEQFPEASFVLVQLVLVAQGAGDRHHVFRRGQGLARGEGAFAFVF